MTDWNGEERRQIVNRHGNHFQGSEPWHIKKEITWGHIMSTIALAATLVISWADMNQKISDNKNGIEATKAEIAHSKEVNNIQIDRFDKAIKEVKDQYNKIDEKLDKLIEKGGHNGH